MGLGLLSNPPGAIPGGLLVFIISLPFYALALYGSVHILGWDLSWRQCSGVMALVMVMRVWDKALFSGKG